MFNLFSLLTSGLSRYFRGRADETQLQRELLSHRRRQLLHQHIPDVHTARAFFGQRFDELEALLVANDPARLQKLAAGSPYYPELARTLLYQFAPVDSPEKMSDLLQQEISLWFGARAASPATVAHLGAAVWQWKNQQ